jgi:hypothetical protein
VVADQDALMSDLTFVDKARLEKLFQMGGGYVLDFSNRTFQEFVADAVRKNIEDNRYDYASCSKANRLRQFWKIEPNHTVGLLTRQMVEYAATVAYVDHALIAEGHTIASRLLSSAPVAELDAITPNTDDRTFEALAKSVRESIDNNQPETGLDRLHTFVVKYVSAVCQQNGLAVVRGKPLHSMVGEYVKHLRAENRLESEMTERILKSSISTLESFNHVRNNQSFAHDNTILNYDESLLIFNHVCASIRFIQSIEQIAARPLENAIESPRHSDDVPI